MKDLETSISIFIFLLALTSPTFAGELITKTVTDARIQWKEGFSLRKLKSKDIKLGFELRESKLYSFSFE